MEKRCLREREASYTCKERVRDRWLKKEKRKRDTEEHAWEKHKESLCEGR